MKYFLGRLHRVKYLLSIKLINRRNVSHEFFLEKHKKLISRIIAEDRTVKVYPIEYFKEQPEPLIDVNLPSVKYTLFCNCKIIGGSNILLPNNNEFIYDSLFFRSKNANFTDIGLFQLVNRVIHFGNIYFINYCRKGENIDEGIMMSGNYSTSYFHFLVEILSKFFYLGKINLPPHIPLIVDSDVKNIRQLMEALSVFGDGRPCLFINKLDLVSVKKLHYISPLNIFPPNIKNINLCKNEDLALDFDALSFLRKRALELFGSKDINRPERIFITRKGGHFRAYNEDQLIPITEKYGFEQIFPAEMTFGQQVSCFANAKFIVSATGAALTNLLFAQEGSIVIVMVPNRFRLTMFSTLAGLLGIKAVFISGVASEKSNFQSDFIINPSALDDCIRFYKDSF